MTFKLHSFSALLTTRLQPARGIEKRVPLKQVSRCEITTQYVTVRGCSLEHDVPCPFKDAVANRDDGGQVAIRNVLTSASEDVGRNGGGDEVEEGQ